MSTLPEKPKITFGLYMHHKGGYYWVDKLVFNTETDKWDILYSASGVNGEYFTRSVDNFFGDIRFVLKAGGSYK